MHARTSIVWFVSSWFRENVRDRLRNDPDVLLATVLFRWFNRIQTGEAIFQQTAAFGQDGGEVKLATPWDCRGGKTSDWIRVLAVSIRAYCGAGPYTNGAYVIFSETGLPKLDGVLSFLEQFCYTEFSWYDERRGTVRGDWRDYAEYCLWKTISLEEAWSTLKQTRGLGPFMTYEVVTDLRHTALLDAAPDVDTWANPGPGALRGAARVLNDLRYSPTYGTLRPASRRATEDVMRLLLEASRDFDFWPQFTEAGSRPALHTSHKYREQMADVLDEWRPGDWPRWEMRDVEHCLCEFDKYERARLGEGRPKQIYR